MSYDDVINTLEQHQLDDCIDFVEQQQSRITELEKQLVLIGERAVVDWDDTTVGLVDSAVPPEEGRKYKDYLRDVLLLIRR